MVRKKKTKIFIKIQGGLAMVRLGTSAQRVALTLLPQILPVVA